MTETTKHPATPPPADTPAAANGPPAPMVLRPTEAVAQPVGYERGLDPTTLDGAFRLSAVLAKSAYFGIRNESDALARIMGGRELGMSAMTALQNLYSFESKNGYVLGEYAESQEGRVIASGLVERWEWLDRSTTGAKLLVKRRGKPEIVIEYNEADARRAGLLDKDNWKNHPRRMYVARCRSEAISLEFPDVKRGIRTLEELRDEVREERESSPQLEGPSTPTVTLAMQEKAATLRQMIQSVTDRAGVRLAREAIKEAEDKGELAGVFLDEVKAAYNETAAKFPAQPKPGGTAPAQQGTLLGGKP